VADGRLHDLLKKGQTRAAYEGGPCTCLPLAAAIVSTLELTFNLLSVYSYTTTTITTPTPSNPHSLWAHCVARDPSDNSAAEKYIDLT
jgi:hypothetical protein